MSDHYWSTERWRIIGVIFLAISAGIGSGFWLVSLLVTSVGYIAWLLFKVRQIHRWLEQGAKSYSVPDSDGVWARFYQLIQNIQKKSAKRKRRTAKLLKRFQGIITGLPYATVVLNGRHEIDWANAKAVDYLNIDIKKDRGQRIDHLIRNPKVYQALFENLSQEIEISLLHNPHRQLALQLITVQNDLKLLIARNISDRVKIQQMRKTFIANASHELRTPLTVIAGYLEIMGQDEDLCDHLKPAVKAASEQSARMQHIIEDLLTLSRLEQSGLKDDASVDVDIPAILQNICHDEATLLLSDTHTLTTEIDNHLQVTGAETEVTSICSNLIHNAIRHTDEGTEVQVIWKKIATGEACLSVADNGQGIPAEHIPHLTERFYRVDKGRSRDQGGTGLGLAIVQHIIFRHGGTFDIQSTVGQGTCFTVCFPAWRALEGDG